MKPAVAADLSGRAMMRAARLTVAVAIGLCLFGARLGAEEAKTGARANPYAALAPRLGTSLRFVSDLAFPGGPSFQVKVYDWVIGPGDEVVDFPLEGFATVEVKAGQVETVIDGTSAVHTEGQYWIVPERAKLSIRIRPGVRRGDNLVSMRAVVLVRK